MAVKAEDFSAALDSMALQIGSLGEAAAALVRRMDERGARGDTDKFIKNPVTGASYDEKQALSRLRYLEQLVQRNGSKKEWETEIASLKSILERDDAETRHDASYRVKVKARGMSQKEDEYTVTAASEHEAGEIARKKANREWGGGGINGEKAWNVVSVVRNDNADGLDEARAQVAANLARLDEEVRDDSRPVDISMARGWGRTYASEGKTWAQAEKALKDEGYGPITIARVKEGYDDQVKKG